MADAPTFHGILPHKRRRLRPFQGASKLCLRRLFDRVARERNRGKVFAVGRSQRLRRWRIRLGVRLGSGPWRHPGRSLGPLRKRKNILTDALVATLGRGRGLRRTLRVEARGDDVRRGGPLRVAQVRPGSPAAVADGFGNRR